MPTGNNFQHATYPRSDPGDRVAYREFQAGAPPDSPAWLDAMAAHGAQLAQARVRAVLFLHGTHLGTDLFGMQRLDEAGGLKRGYSRGIPGMEALLALMREDSNGVPAFRGGRKPPFNDDEATKKLIDEQAGDAGNFSAAYVDLFTKAVNRNVSQPITCARHLWSSEHHHLGRAQAAVRLITRLRALCVEQKLGAGDRILVQAHGQAGLVLALVSNLLALGKSSGRETMFQILKGHMPAGEIEQLESFLPTGNVLNGAALDVVTFGTPIRYGWDPSGLGKLLHIINHRPMRIDGKQWLAKMELPQITMEMPIAWGGDYVQQLAVAGSDAVPPSEAAKAANKALWELLEPWDGFERWLECARRCTRCANDGMCLLIDYKDSGSTNARDHLYGHAAYTRMNAILSNTTEIVLTLYAPPSTS
ncbi:MAG: hypothetical protein HY581_08120 [Nitrospirae bacterium]|nr:hypothetical protein [Nitrospirota bacterium]